ncbi:MAG: hypothetical protein ACI4LN_05495, partial [Anaerovoracaceae bacterium]
MKKTGRPPRYVVLFLIIALMIIISTAYWVSYSQDASENTVNELGEFYLEEITERNTATITSELEKKTRQMESALTVLDQTHLRNEASVREYIDMVQKINGLDMFALVDEKGMVYTADSIFSGISRFSFLSEKITETQIH